MWGGGLSYWIVLLSDDSTGTWQSSKPTMSSVTDVWVAQVALWHIVTHDWMSCHVYCKFESQCFPRKQGLSTQRVKECWRAFAWINIPLRKPKGAEYHYCVFSGEILKGNRHHPLLHKIQQGSDMPMSGKQKVVQTCVLESGVVCTQRHKHTNNEFGIDESGGELIRLIRLFLWKWKWLRNTAPHAFLYLIPFSLAPYPVTITY